MQGGVPEMNTERKTRIFVTDDSLSILVMLRRILEDEGYEVKTAYSAEELLEMIAEETPDLFLLDIGLPDMDGFTLCRRLREDPRCLFIPIIFVTARSSTEDVVKGFEAGASDYIPKPFNRAEVVARIRTHLRLSEALRQLDRMGAVPGGV